eukprot:6049707-Pleurochrysis_carterae.AAC.1
MRTCMRNENEISPQNGTANRCMQDSESGNTMCGEIRRGTMAAARLAKRQRDRASKVELQAWAVARQQPVVLLH